MGGRGQLPACVRGLAGYRGEVLHAQAGGIAAHELQGVGLPLDAVDMAFPGDHSHFQGYAAGARAHVPADGVFREPQLAEADGPHLALGHGHGLLPLEHAVREAGGQHRVGAGILDQHGAEAVKVLLRQLFRRAGSELFIGIAEPLPHVDGHMAEAGLREADAEGPRPVVPAHQGEDAAVTAHVGSSVMLSAVEAYGHHVLVGGAQLRAEAAEGAETGQHRHPAEIQQGQQLLRAAEKPAVPGHDHREPAVFPVGADALRNGVRRDGAARSLALAGHRLQHPFRPDEAVGILDGLPHRQGHLLPAAGADAHHGHLLLPPQAEALAQAVDGLGKAEAFQLGGTAQDDELRPRGGGGRGLFPEAAGAPAVLGHQVIRADGLQGGDIQLLGKGPLHGDDVGGRQPRRLAGNEGGAHGQHAGPDPPGEIPDAGVFPQGFAAGGEEDIPLVIVQPRHRRGRIRQEHRTLRHRAVLPQHPQVFPARLPAGCRHVLRHHVGVGVGGVQHQVEVVFLQKGGHLLFVQPPRQDLQARRGRQECLPILRGHAGGDGGLIPLTREEFRQLPALRGPGKNAEIIHPDTLWASPSRRRSASWRRCR